MSAPRRLGVGICVGIGLLVLGASLHGARVSPSGCTRWSGRAWAAVGQAAPGGIREAQSDAEAIADYYPLVEGHGREYAIREASGQTGRLSETVAGTRPINGAPATRLAISDGTEAYVTLDEAGLRIQGELGPSLGFVAYNPPILLTARQFRPGDQWVTRTTATLTAGTLPIEATAEVVGFADVTVPAGKFPRTAHVRLTTRLASIASVAEVWMARGVGEVQGIDGTRRQNELVSTSYPTLTLFTDRTTYRVAETLDLSATVTGAFRIADPYVVLRTPDGTFLQLGRQGLGPVGALGFQPAVPAWPLTPFSGSLFRAALDRAGDYAWLGVLTQPGGNVGDARAWVSNVGSAAFRVSVPGG